MNKIFFDQLAKCISNHFPSKEGGCAVSGYPQQEPYKNDLFRICINAFEKEDKSSLAWDRISEDLSNEVLRKIPYLTFEDIEQTFHKIGNMWHEWIYVLSKINGDIKSIDEPFDMRISVK